MTCSETSSISGFTHSRFCSAAGLVIFDPGFFGCLLDRFHVFLLKVVVHADRVAIGRQAFAST